MEGMYAEDLIEPAQNPGRVLIIGGGPGGMEAARVAALRGHKVTLVEASSTLGGQVAIARRAPRLHSIGDIAFWLEQEIYRLGVEVRSEAQSIPADTVVFISAKEGLREIYDDLREKGFERSRNIVIVGDALAPRDLQCAITEGHRAVRQMVWRAA